MSKILKLFINEMIKALKRKSTKIMIILAIASIFLSMGFVKFIKMMNESSENIAFDVVDWKEELKEDNEELRKILNDDSNYDEYTKAEMRARLETNELAIENDINYMYGASYWKIDVLNDLRNAKTTLYLLEENSEEYRKQSKEIEEEIKILKDNNYDKYIDSQIEKVKIQFDSEQITKSEYEILIESLELKQKYQVGKEEQDEISWKESLIYEIGTIKRSINSGLDYITNKVLTTEKVQEMKESLAIDMYRLEHNIPTVTSLMDYRSFYDYISATMPMFMVAILIIILAGSNISSEISTGTIKFWLMTPNKRWKILLGKILSMIALLIIITFILAILSNIVGNIFFEEEASSYLYVRNGEVKELSPIVYNILKFLSYDIDIIIYMLLALMLSTIMRNTGFAISLSMGLYAGSGLIMQIINSFVTADWLKFIPFNNMNLTNKIFKNAISYTDMVMVSNSVNNVSIIFSLAVLAVCAILMLVTMFDSFNKRDV